MTAFDDEPVLSRPEPAAVPGPLDDRLYDLVEARFRRLVADHPILATYLGLHARDGDLDDGSRDAVLADLEADRRHLAQVEGLDPAGLSPEARFERDLEIHNVRRSIFDTDVVRTWERRSTALDLLGDALFLVSARDFAPLAERLASITSRLEGVPSFLDQHRTRADGPQVRLWQELEIEASRDLPALIRELAETGETTLAAGESRRLRRTAERAQAAIAEYGRGLRDSMADGTDDWVLGRERYDELVARRAFDGLDSDAILEIGWQQLAENRAARAATAAEIDPAADEAAVVERVKSDHPATFAEALEEYRSAMARARAHLVDRDLVTVPGDERIDVLPTPAYLRKVIPFAAYFDPPRFDREPSGIYIVTPSVDGSPSAMREHNRSSISNTSIHEAYPGHHLQLSVSNRHPSLTRLLADAPEFVEGWGMYSEQLMREEGFDDGPEFRLGMYTDAIWRACRIVLDIRMHRGEVTVEEGIRFMVEHTGFEEASARAEVHRYTYTPTYQLSYLLGKALLLQLRADERARLGERFSLKAFHDTLLRNGSLPISFHRRLIADGAAGGAGEAAAAGRGDAAAR